MDYSKITFKNYLPSYQKYFDSLNSDKSVTDFVSFSPYDSTLIFYEDDFCGCFKVIPFDDENKEIHIALISKYRGHGLASYIINVVSNNIFSSYDNCEYMVLSIDKENKASLKLASKCNFYFNEQLTNENIKYGDNHTLVFIKDNPYFKQKSK